MVAVSLFIWRAGRSGTFNDADSIITMSFSEIENKELSLFAAELLEKLSVPVIVPYEVGELEPLNRTQGDITLIYPVSGLRFDSRFFLEKVNEEMTKKGLKRSIILADWWHLPRSIWTAEKLGMTVIEPREVIQRLNDRVNFSRRVTGFAKIKATTAWLMHDVAGRVYYLLRGWI